MIWIRKNEHASSVLEVFVVLDLSARPYLQIARPTRKIQSSPKLRQVRKGNAEIPDTQRGLTGIGSLVRASLNFARALLI